MTGYVEFRESQATSEMNQRFQNSAIWVKLQEELLLVKNLFFSLIRDWFVGGQDRVILRPVNSAVLPFWAEDSGEMRGRMQQLD